MLLAALALTLAFACQGFAPEPKLRDPYAADPVTGRFPDHVVIVQEDEFRIRITQIDGRPTGGNLANTTLPSEGMTRFWITNSGKAAHDFEIRLPDIKFKENPGTIRPGSITVLEANLASGTYTLVCTLGNHEKLGMVGKLKVLVKSP